MSFQTPLGVARGNGTARSGTGHGLVQHAIALALIPIGLAAAVLFFWMIQVGYAGAVSLLRQPWVLLFVVLLVALPFWHGYLGIKVIIEDYVSNKRLAYTAITLIRFLSVAVALLGIIAAAKIGFGG